ncbi:bifunctional demethylmenaquinone methyltransferase/2-methoxy-6-polyprenyl-1,4-benzoquinol methylase UbiE [Wenyingzhuangia aestuarii]|uniref:bifunctional demethylmenaquinone methyltransferase/2-methoxy-6-polyprenyl-1,4-benzoquinol methylase UbiE n=1 Tax=Wenyingzhuangia aestuarii TaxID=1647582 RepID=UPI00143A29F8|nr:bifunctional demethylmenaquinone methyltransferase/2-methoxy-6-polyprenyl-1,4-benzoquinol methylase UbiE [Wenyingzhuangia aestuarii]NJB81632.1 demethylmenaquinone methyltransferase/2-methoxy-6-polyprenyl-1,4-benzoquinol methylase [Wenyingzhuangia aestuarii]
MSKTIKPYKDSNATKKDQVANMFDNISGNYDGLNRVITFGIDVKWREKVVSLVKATNPKKILDIATGTGDLAIMQSKAIPTAEVVGLDISAGMLEVGKDKIKNLGLEASIELVLGDSENIPYEDHFFDAITVSYGVRNFENLNKGLQEIYRVLKPGGIFIVLETSVPTKFPFKQGYQFHSKVILPLVGRLFSKDKIAYSYLSESANSFPYGEAFNTILKDNGFNNVEDLPVTFGVSTIYKATK